MIADETEAVADVKFQASLPSDKLAGSEQPARTASRFTKHETKAVRREDRCDNRHSRPESNSAVHRNMRMSNSKGMGSRNVTMEKSGCTGLSKMFHSPRIAA